MPYRKDLTTVATSKGDMWQYNLDSCPQNCSMNGDCSFSNCLCHDGFYGMDCSNSYESPFFSIYRENKQRYFCIEPVLEASVLLMNRLNYSPVLIVVSVGMNILPMIRMWLMLRNYPVLRKIKEGRMGSVTVSENASVLLPL